MICTASPAFAMEDIEELPQAHVTHLAMVPTLRLYAKNVGEEFSFNGRQVPEGKDVSKLEVVQHFIAGPEDMDPQRKFRITEKLHLKTTPEIP